MKNYISAPDGASFVAPYAVASGGGALIGPGLFGVAKITIASGQSGPFELRGIFQMPKAAGAIAVGAKIYWDNTAKVLTTTATSNTHVGAAAAAAAAGDATVLAYLPGIAI
ncbi:DUF2190 family protein [Sphingomonas elodea]|uniref:DUF2190 family protein n=1 Tax=Sphingomonas elodea TaxID=179878 RepID=UPI0002631DC8|nr:DUF2190 family protein [Sphingomonas elodea]